jgi:putative membrane protein
MKTIPHSRVLLQFGLLAGAVAFVGTGTASAASRPRVADEPTPSPVVRTTDNRNEPTLKHADKAFIEKAARLGLDEVQISRVAADRSSNPDVRQFAQMLITDHEASNQELAALAAAKGVNIPAKDANNDKWAKRNAKKFDPDYLAKMASDHDEVVKLFEKEAKDGTDADTVAFARKYLPKLQEHQQRANDLKRALK